MKRLARLVAAAELPVILAMAPVLLFPTPERLKVLVVVPFIWLCASINGDRFIPRTPMNTALGLLLGMVGVSLYATFDIQFSLEKVSGTVLGALLFWTVVRWLTTPRRLHVAVAVFLVVGAGLAVIGVIGVMTGSKAHAVAELVEHWAMPVRLAFFETMNPYLGQMSGFGLNPNPIAGCLVLFVPLQAVLLVVGLRGYRRSMVTRQRAHWLLVFIQGLLLLITAGTVWAMQSHGAWAGLAVAAGVFLVSQNRVIRMLATSAAGVILALVAVLGTNDLIDTATARSGINLADAISIREDLWSKGLLGVQESPFTGLGMNTFREIMPARYPLEFLTPPNEQIAHSHNNLIQAAWDLGIPGLVAYASLWILAALLLIRIYRHSNERVYRAIASGLGAGLIAHFTFGMTDAIPLGAKVGATFWLALALVVGLHRVALGSGMSHVSQIGPKGTG